jgi:hypothetical protein
MRPPVEGRPEEPSRFVLRDFQGSDEDLFVVVKDRVAIQNLDYMGDSSRFTLTFRGDIDLEKNRYMIRFDTPTGASSIDNWEPEYIDHLAYLDAPHNWQVFRRWYRSHETIYFLEGGAGGRRHGSG